MLHTGRGAAWRRQALGASVVWVGEEGYGGETRGGVEEHGGVWRFLIGKCAAEKKCCGGCISGIDWYFHSEY